VRKYILGLVAALTVSPVVANEPVALSSLGLSSIEVVSEEAGMEVRGLSSSAASSGLAAVAGIIFDPATGSQFNFNNNNYSSGTDENAGLGESSATEINTLASLGDFTINIGTFTADFSGAGSIGASKGLSGLNNNAIVPSFDLTAFGN
jgi:hypothetical protein